MHEVQTVVSVLWWFPYATLLLAAGCITVGMSHAYRALWLWRHQDTPINAIVAKALEGVKAPPYFIYAAVWLISGMVLAGLTFIMWH